MDELLKNDVKMSRTETVKKNIPNRRFHVNHQYSKSELKADRTRKFKNNKISTAKYSCLTFLPLNLFYQFTKFSNIYFLMMAFLQMIPAISNSNGYPTMLTPLLFVLLVSMVKDIVEDVQRHKFDNLENNRVVTMSVEVRQPGKGSRASRTSRTSHGSALKSYEFKEVKCEQVEVGRVVKVKQDEQISADLLLINSSSAKGSCYIETKNLDGETNLKYK
mmetsp:Transcript_30715/g.30204  ORF Transcript_30715/g.30204 Transcript_30715/m.30204 type:complete len:219 (+) Transcript_30715:222-878(+)